MKVLNIGLERPVIIPTTIIMTMVFLMIKVFECLWVMEGVDIGFLRPATLPLEIIGFIMVEIKVVMTVEVDIGINRSSTLPPSIAEKDLMLMGEVDIAPRPTNNPSITQVDVVDFQVSNFLLVQLTKILMVMIE